jgi:hypothetical protein
MSWPMSIPTTAPATTTRIIRSPRPLLDRGTAGLRLTLKFLCLPVPRVCEERAAFT